MKRFEDLLVWQKAQGLYLELYAKYADSKNFFFRDQLLRAGLSISNNRAEGYERMSDKEFRYFLFVAKGSCGEVRSMLYLAEQQGEIYPEELNDLVNHCLEISKMIGGLIKRMEI